MRTIKIPTTILIVPPERCDRVQLKFVRLNVPIISY